jgi:GT2 family glycosyltransferase
MNSADVARVRVVILNYDGGDLTMACLRSVLATQWSASALEIVLVDNASRDGIADKVERELPTVRVMRSDRNRGFAGGNNLALRDLDAVDFVALVNNDATVGPDWLAPLVAALEKDHRVGAACPKILLTGRYHDLHLSTPAASARFGDGRRRGVRIHDHEAPAGARGRVHRAAGFWGPEAGRDEPYEWTADSFRLLVPDGRGPLRLRIASDDPKPLTIVSGAEQVLVPLVAGTQWYDVALTGPAVDVVNNAGSDLLPNGYVADRGWLAVDGPPYDTEADVFAWCGAAVLLRPDYLRDVGLFDERLFLYYEDVELAWRGQARGWRFRYVPASVVRHEHSATATSGSALARYYNERNRLLVLLRHAPVGLALTAPLRFLASTASYARRDLLAARDEHSRRSLRLVTERLRAFAGFVKLAPAMARDRVRDRSAGRSAPSRSR